MRLHTNVPDETLKEVIKEFIGKIMQLPPVRSRVKREIREREVKSFDIIEREGNDVLFVTQVQAGTYIRKICDDMGKKIGGAHMLELRRVQAGIFDEGKETPIYSLYDFDKAIEAYKNGNESLLREMIVPAEIISQFLPSIQFKGNLKPLLTGKPIMKGDIKPVPEGEVFCLFVKDKLIGVYKKVNEGHIIARAEFVVN